MVSAFQFGFNENPAAQTKYSTPGAMEQIGLEDLKAPWASTVVPAIWDNVETMGDILQGSTNINTLNQQAYEAGEERIPAAELNAKYPHMHFDTSQYASTAKYMSERGLRVQDLEWLKEHSTVKTKGALFIPEILSYISKSFTDPVELGIMAAMWGTGAILRTAVPQLAKFSGTGLAYKMAGMALPENALIADMSAAHLPLSARLSGRLVEGFAENALGNLAVEPWVMSASKRLGDDYTMLNSLMNVVVGGLTGSVFHTVGGAISDPFIRMSTENKLKAAAEHLALKMNGEDGIMSAAQNVLPVTTLTAQDVFVAKNVDIVKRADGQYVVKFTDEQGLLGQHAGVIGKTLGDAIRNLQYMYATKTNDAILFRQLNEVYGNVSAPLTSDTNLRPFSGTSKLRTIKNTTSIRRGRTRYKLDFESQADRVFYAISKILNRKKNANKSFSEIVDQKDVLIEALEWITQNLGDTTEADIRSHAMQVTKYITGQADKNFSATNPDKAIKVPAIIKSSDFYVHPEFLSSDSWKGRLEEQKAILLGADKEAAINLLGEIYSANKEVYTVRLESLKAARSEIQKLINTTDEQLKAFSKRDLVRKNIVDSIKAATKHITDEQLTQYLYMLDVVTGDFTRFLEENNIVYTASKEQQAKTEQRLKQTVLERKSKRKGLEDPLQFYKATPEEIMEDSFTVSEMGLYGSAIDAVIEAKTGKYDLQAALKQDFEELSEADQQMLEGLDMAVEHSHLKNDTRLFRGLTRRETLAVLGTDIKPGMVIQSKGFLGTSFDEMQADRFASAGQTDEGREVLLEVRAPKGSYALDVDAAIALNHKHSLKHNWTEQIAKAETIDDLDSPDFDDVLFGDSDDLTFTLGVMEGEIILPREMALKVLEVKQEDNQQRVIVTPDATLNNIYGSNIFRDNVDLFFNKVQEMNTNYKMQLDQLQIGTPEHKAVATEAFFNGYILSDETINAYPELRIARDLTQEIPGTWLMQATNKESLANRIVGEFMQDMTPEKFMMNYGYNYVYALGNGKFTRSPERAIAATGKAVLYEIPAGPYFSVQSSHIYSNVLEALVEWEPALKQYIDQGEDVQFQVLQKLAAEAPTFLNKSGVSFLQYLDAMNLTSRKKIKKQTEWGRLMFDDGEIIYPLQNIPGEVKQIGEITLFNKLSPDAVPAVSPEMIYKSIVRGMINEVENLQTDIVKLKKERADVKKEQTAQAPSQNQLDTQVETQAKRLETNKKETIKKEKQLKEAKKKRERIIKNVNEKAEPYNAVIKGAVDVSTEGRYIVTLFQNADISTLVHETAHIFRRTMLDADMLEQAEAALGVKDGKWTVKNEEDFAVAFEKYLAEGKAPAKGLEAMFEAFKSWLTQIYIKLSQSPMEQDFSPELRQVFDQLFAEERLRMAEQAGYKHENITKQMYSNALEQHRNSLDRINQNIKDIETLLKNESVLDKATFAKFQQEKLARIQSKLDMLETPEALTQSEIRDKMKEISIEARREENEYKEIADSQYQKNVEFKGDDASFYENELAMAENSLMTYANTLGLTEEQVSMLLNESTDDLNMAKLQEEAEANAILEGALREFGDCARGEL